MSNKTITLITEKEILTVDISVNNFQEEDCTNIDCRFTDTNGNEIHNIADNIFEALNDVDNFDNLKHGARYTIDEKDELQDLEDLTGYLDDCTIDLHKTIEREYYYRICNDLFETELYLKDLTDYTKVSFTEVREGVQSAGLMKLIQEYVLDEKKIVPMADFDTEKDNVDVLPNAVDDELWIVFSEDTEKGYMFDEFGEVHDLNASGYARAIVDGDDNKELGIRYKEFKHGDKIVAKLTTDYKVGRKEAWWISGH